MQHCMTSCAERRCPNVAGGWVAGCLWWAGHLRDTIASRPTYCGRHEEGILDELLRCWPVNGGQSTTCNSQVGSGARRVAVGQLRPLWPVEAVAVGALSRVHALSPAESVCVQAASAWVTTSFQQWYNLPFRYLQPYLLVSVLSATRFQSLTA